MIQPGQPQIDSMREIRVELATRLRQRSTEIEATVLARIRALSDPVQAGDPEYSAGLREAVAESVEFALTVVEQGGDWSGPTPSAAAEQARRAARNGIGLDTVLRRYAAGDRLIGEFIMGETDRFSSDALRIVMSAQGPQVDRLMAFVASEYMDELEQMRRSPAQRLAERVQRLLAGDGSVDTTGLEYEVGGWHVGIVAMGPDSGPALRELATGLDRQLLSVPRGDRLAWAWLGGRRPLDVAEIERFLPLSTASGTSLAIGEPRQGLDGWRLTHSEAKAALEVMLRKPQALTRGSDVILTAAMLRNEVLVRSLMKTYLSPLEGEGQSGAAIRETLRAYFAAGLNAATAAAALGVDRHTVQRRLRKAEAALGRRIDSCHAELEVALKLEELGDAPSPEVVPAVE
jgi:hypothetical protein